MKIGKTIVKALVSLTLLVILVAGLHPKDFSLTEAMHSEPQYGLAGAKHRLAASENFLPATLISTLNKEGFGVVMELTMPEKPAEHFMAVATITTGDEEDHFFIGQWSDTLIIMMGNDYPNKSRRPTLHVKPKQIHGDNPGPISFTLKLLFSADGASAFYNGKKIASNARFRAKLPGGLEQNDPENENREQSTKAFVTLTNAANREHGWPGRIAQFELLSSARTETAAVVAAVVGYDFTSTPVGTQSTLENAEIKLLANHQVRKVQLLSQSLKYFSKGRSSLVDILLNVAAFVPLGLFCFLLLYKQAGVLAPFVVSCLAGSFLSLAIEMVQSVLPSRHSSLFDLFFNSAGTVIGALLAILFVSIKVSRNSKQVNNAQQYTQQQAKQEP